MGGVQIELPMDHYALYLAEINKKHPVLTSKAILNQQGVPLIAEGRNITPENAQILIKHKLLEPLESQVILSKSLVTTDLLKHFKAVFFSYPDLGVMQDRLNSAVLFQRLVNMLKLPPQVIQKLTVQHAELHKHYTKSLITAWLSILIGQQLGGDEGDMINLFVAAIIRDLGFLHLDPSTVNKQGKLNANEWRMIQSHVLLSQKFCESLGLNKTIIRAVAEHHERCDSTGYPFSYSGTQISEHGQVLGMADSIQAIRTGLFDEQGRTLGDIRPYIHLNHSTFSSEVYRSAARVFINAGLDKTRQLPGVNYSALIADIIGRLHLISSISGKLEEILSSPMKQCGARDCRRITSVTRRIIDSIRTSGVLIPELINYYINLDPGDPEQKVELIEMDTLTGELSWQISELVKYFTTYKGEGCKNKCASCVAPFADWLTSASECIGPN